MSDLLRRLERSRERRVDLDEIDGRTLSVTIRRPPLIAFSKDLMGLMSQRQNGKFLPGEISLRYVVGWSGIQENDILTSASDDPAEFGPALAAAWLEDRSDYLKRIDEAFWQAVEEANSTKDAVEKN